MLTRKVYTEIGQLKYFLYKYDSPDQIFIISANFLGDLTLVLASIPAEDDKSTSDISHGSH